MKRWEVKNTGQNIPVTTRAQERPSGNETPHIIIANGFVGGTLADKFAMHLGNVTGGDMTVSTYEEPYVGSDGYAEAYRTEIFDKVVRAIGGRVLVLAHSRGMVAWANSGSGLIRDELVEGLAGLTPMGISDLPQLSNSDLARRLGAEISHPPFTTLDSTLMTLKISGHILKRCRRPRAVAEEIIRTLRTDTGESTVATSQAIPTVMIVGSRDRLVPPSEVENKLDAESGYRGQLVEIAASHASAFADSRHAPAIAAAVKNLTPKA